ncbi:hemolysin D [Brevibacillus fluminis]|uniref:Hemolysin D n=1 Tax=Brevibacillus fluminis TaxID=511487 RepID=A0A3M8DAJ3_9BACL|nr:hemolysin III family protein [Brevibacillus fluminis]RNB84609.1 hemolysin D [Brevibacillus fluminis]
MASTHVFSKAEEVANSITHGLGALLCIPALVLLVTFAARFGSAWHVVSFTLFGVTMLLLYVSSTMLHALPTGKAKDVFEVMDHSSIYFFIAGTYTPFLFLAVKGWLGWTLFGIVWGMAVGGTVFKCFFAKKFLFLSTLLYVVMGWLIIFAWNDLAMHLQGIGLMLLIIGGVLYSVGAIFYVWRGFTFHHAVWHLFVLGGSTAHFFSVLQLLPA